MNQKINQRKEERDSIDKMINSKSKNDTMNILQKFRKLNNQNT